jgi:protein ImuA
MSTGESPVSAWLQRCLFLDPLTDAERFWVIGEALRCGGIKVVVADGSGLTPTASRRLQLAAEAGGKSGALGLLARPPWEMDGPSWATTRWQVRPQPATQAGAMAWAIELKRCRGRQPGPEVPRQWTMEWTYQVFRGTSALHLSPGVGCGTATTADAAGQAPQSRIA